MIILLLVLIFLALTAPDLALGLFAGLIWLAMIAVGVSFVAGIAIIVIAAIGG